MKVTEVNTLCRRVSFSLNLRMSNHTPNAFKFSSHVWVARLLRCRPFSDRRDIWSENIFSRNSAVKVSARTSCGNERQFQIGNGSGMVASNLAGNRLDYSNLEFGRSSFECSELSLEITFPLR